MNGFWSGWVIFLIVLNLGVAVALFVFSQRVEIPTRPDGTTGHTWAHGVLREGVRRLPLWWVVMSAAGFVAAVVYLALYPALGGYQGLLGWTSADEHARASAENDARLGPVLAALDPGSLDAISSGHPAAAHGRTLYLDNCAACHGVEGRGNTALGAPSLTDSAWLYGGDPSTLVAS